ncbi:P-loop containing nucleoside triphosphate hydrolase protein [Mrakia frigida]|uniref:putative AAA family ATPase GCN20 n=1 Tax=Mrakia frigida TaxID=29902 RepID=UPI003FCC1D61
MAELAEDIRTTLPYTDETVVSYIVGLLEDEEEDEKEILEMTKGMLEGGPQGDDNLADLEALIGRLSEFLAASETRQKPRTTGSLKALDEVIDMKKSGMAMSATIGLNGQVDLEHSGKGQASRVDLKKLEKAEAKIKAKLEKRNRRDLFEGSKLIDLQKKQESYEEMFMKVNPLDMGNKNKPKDIHLASIDVNFGSLRILTNAALTLAHGRRYGLIGRNGIGKSTLLRNMALREVAIPSHISVLYVEQEIVGDDTTALESVLQADVWRHHLLTQEAEINAGLASATVSEVEKDDMTARLGDIQKKLIDMEAETGPARAAQLLVGLGFEVEDQQKPTKAFSGGWRMRLALARALFVKPDLLMLDEPSNMLDLNAIAWLEDYLQTWQSTLLVVSHDRSFLDAVATDIIWQHSERLDYYKGNFTQFYATKTERARTQQKEYDTQLAYRAHLQAYIDRWRYNANRAPQAQSKIKILEKLPDLEPPEAEESESFKFPDAEKISPPLLQLDNVTFGYTPEKIILKSVNIDVGLDSRIAVIGPNGAGKSTLIKLLVGDLETMQGTAVRNGRLRIAFFAQHHVDSLDLTLSPVAFLASKFPGQSEQEYRQHLGAFGITGLTGLQKIATLSGGQKSRVAFSVLSMQRPHILLLDEPSNHLDIEGIDALMGAIKKWNGGVILISHDTRFITTVANELWVCANGTVQKFFGDVSAYKSLIVANHKAKP